MGGEGEREKGEERGGREGKATAEGRSVGCGGDGRQGGQRGKARRIAQGRNGETKCRDRRPAGYEKRFG